MQLANVPAGAVHLQMSISGVVICGYGVDGPAGKLTGPAG